MIDQHSDFGVADVAMSGYSFLINCLVLNIPRFLFNDSASIRILLNRNLNSGGLSYKENLMVCEFQSPLVWWTLGKFQAADPTNIITDQLSSCHFSFYGI